MTEKHLKEVTIKLGIWEDHPLYSLDVVDWSDWMGVIVRENLRDYDNGTGRGVQYGVGLDTFGPWEDSE